MQDTVTELLNFETFLQELEVGERTSFWHNFIQCGLASTTSFPFDVPYTNLVVTFSKRYNLETQEIPAESGKVVVRINPESISRSLCLP